MEKKKRPKHSPQHGNVHSIRASSSFQVRSQGIRNKRPRTEYASRRQRLQSAKRKSITNASSVPVLTRHKSPILRTHLNPLSGLIDSSSSSTIPIAISQSTITTILTNWLRRSGIRTVTVLRRHILYTLTAYSIQRFEFDEYHHHIQTWINFDILPDDHNKDMTTSTGTSCNIDTISNSNSNSTTNKHGKHCKQQQSPILIPTSTTPPVTEAPECADLNFDIEETSLSSISDVLPPLSPTVSSSLSQSLSAVSSSGSSSSSNSMSGSLATAPSTTERNCKQCTLTLNKSINWECTASLPLTKWSTILLGVPLDASLHHQVYVANVSIDKLGYGMGIALFGHNKHDDQFEDVEMERNLFSNPDTLTTTIQRKYGGYPDAMGNCFVVYDDGSYHDWNGKGNDDGSPSSNVNGCNLNDLPLIYPGSKNRQNGNGTVQVISKLSRYPLKSKKPDDLKLTPSPVLSPDSNAESVTQSSNRMNRSKPKKGFYSGPKHRKKKKKITEKFGFDEKRDIVQISVDMVHRKVLIHNLQSHRCVVIRDFHYDSLRIGFALRKSKVTVIDQKWI